MLIADKFCDVCEIQIMDKGEEKFFKKFSLIVFLSEVNAFLTLSFLQYFHLITHESLAHCHPLNCVHK